MPPTAAFEAVVREATFNSNNDLSPSAMLELATEPGREEEVDDAPPNNVDGVPVPPPAPPPAVFRPIEDSNDAEFAKSDSKSKLVAPVGVFMAVGGLGLLDIPPMNGREEEPVAAEPPLAEPYPPIPPMPPMLAPPLA